jgi:hypothetical protein
LISISFWILSSVTFTISPLTIPNTSVLISISFWILASGNRYQYRSVRDS